jgi:hypothetical protein
MAFRSPRKIGPNRVAADALHTSRTEVPGWCVIVRGLALLACDRPRLMVTVSAPSQLGASGRVQVPAK